MGSLITHIATAATAVTAALAAAMMATAMVGMTGTVTLLWASVVVTIATTGVTVTRAVAAWRRAYLLGQYHARINAILARPLELAGAEK